MRRLIGCVAVVSFIFFCNPIRAQYFDWVERYTGGEADNFSNTNEIIQSIVDSDGNIYFIGRCATDAGFHSNNFLPMTPYGPYSNTVCLVIGKLSSAGEFMWGKIIHGNNGAKHPYGHIQIIGDTAIACFVNRLSAGPTTINSYLYYLDTLFKFCYYDTNGVFVEENTVVYRGDTLRKPIFASGLASAYILINSDGTVKETHWLTTALLDTNGNPFTYGGYDLIQNKSLTYGDHPFLIDNNGNIFVINSMIADVIVFDSVYDDIEYDIQSSEIGGLRFYIDDKRYFDVMLPENRPSRDPYNYQLLKFSPHFEELLASQFLFEPTPEHLDTICSSTISDLKCDNDNNIYLLVNSDYFNLSMTGEENSLRIGGSDNMNLRFRSYDLEKGFLVKYDTLLNPVYLRQYERDSSVVLSGTTYGLTSRMGVTQFDDEGNMVIFCGALSLSMDSAITSCFFDTTELELGRVFIRINPETGAVVSQGPGMSAEVNAFNGNSSFAVSGNRIIRQGKYRWYLDFADSLYEMPQQSQWGMGFAVWDYDGNELYFVDYGVNGGSNNATSSVCLRDSVLYLTGMLASGGAQFGDITVPNSGSSQSFIARYVDTAFMHPYVRPGSQQDIQLVVQDGEPVVTVYPNPCAQRVKVHYEGSEPLKSAFVTDITGRQHQVFLSAQGDGQYSVDFSSMPPANYLLTLITSSGKHITSRLLKR